MMGRQSGDQTSLFYEFRLDDRIPKDHLLRRINLYLTPVLGGMHQQLAPYYSEIGRPSIDPELMIRMLIVGYCYGLRSERKLTQEVELHLAYRWFCRLDLNDRIPHHSTFSENRLRKAPLPSLQTVLSRGRRLNGGHQSRQGSEDHDDLSKPLHLLTSSSNRPAATDVLSLK